MPECAFCDHDGKLSAEHIASQWMNDLMPGRKTAFFVRGEQDRRTFETDTIDWKAKVVCENCNNTWMSDIEKNYAQPALTPLITGEIGVPIDLERAHALSLFAFKTAVVMDHQNRQNSERPFFSKRDRHAFRIKRTIPRNVNMWFCGYKGHQGSGQFKTAYMKDESPTSDHSLMYVCTCAIGHFVFQVLTVKQVGNASFRPISGYESLGVPFYPRVPINCIWPPRYLLDGIDQFEAFSDRWRNVFKIGY